jgi:hypothetical protein
MLTATLLGFASDLNNGRYNGVGVLLVMAAVLTGLVAQFRFRSRLGAHRVLVPCVAIQLWQCVQSWSLSGVGAKVPSGFGLVALILGVLCLIAAWPRPRLAIGLGIGAFGLAAGSVLIHSPVSMIDVWFFQQDAATGLLSGSNPYHTVYQNIYSDTYVYGPGVLADDNTLTYSFPYLPMSLLLVLPGRLLGDIRWSLLLAMLIGAGLLWLMRRDRLGALIGLLLLSSPHALNVVCTGWTEPLIVMSTAWVGWSVARGSKWVWLPLGVLLACKQYMALAVPLAWAFLGFRATFRAILAAACVTLPFVLLDPRAFWRSVVEWQLVQPFRFDSLSISALIFKYTQSQLPSAVAFLAAAGAIVGCGLRSGRHPTMFFPSLALTLLIFFSLNKQAFGNYYMGVIGMCCAAMMGTNRDHRLRV